MIKTNLDAMLIDFLEGNLAWAELFDVLGQVNDETVLAALEKLLHIRKIDSDTSMDIVEESVRMLGLNLERDIMAMRSASFKKVFDALPDYAQTVGTKDWTKFCSFILGSQFETAPLYTNDYVSFLPTPLGTLIQDGGQWYKTNHVDLMIDSNLIQRGLDLTIMQYDEEIVISSLIAIGMAETVANEWFHDHLFVEPNNVDFTQQVIRAQIFIRRLKEFFYKWAPVELVLDKVYSTIQIARKLFVTAHIVLEPTMRLSLGKPLVDTKQPLPFPILRAGEELVFGILIKYSDGTDKTEYATALDSPHILSRTDKGVILKEPNSITNITLMVKHEKDLYEIQGKLFPIDTNPDPVNLHITHQPLYGTASHRVRIYGEFDNGSRSEFVSSSSVRLSTTLGFFEGHNLVLPQVLSDTELEITVEYVGMFQMERTFKAVASKSVTTRLPVSMKIVAPEVIVHGVDSGIECRVMYNDGEEVSVFPQYSTSTDKVSIVESIIKSGIQKTDYKATIVASFMDQLTVTATKPVVFRASKPILAKIELELPEIIQEGMTIYPRAVGIYVKEIATPEQLQRLDESIIVSREPLKGQWFSSALEDAGVRSLPVIDMNTGEFQAPFVSQLTPFRLHFVFSEGSGVRTELRTFDILNSELRPLGVSINAATKIYSGGVVPLRTFAKWTDDKNYAAHVTYSLEYIPSQSAIVEARLEQKAVSDSIAASGGTPEDTSGAIDFTQKHTLELVETESEAYDTRTETNFKIRGVYYVGDYHGVARVTATYSFEGQDHIDVRDIPLVPKRDLVESVEIESLPVYNDQSRTFLRLKAVYQDGRTEYVVGDWFAEWPDEGDDYTLLEFAPGVFDGLTAITIVEGRAPVSTEDFLSMKSSSLPVFKGLGGIEDLKKTMITGTVVSFGKVNQTTEVEIHARYFRRETKVDASVIITPREPVDKIVNARIEGATSFGADTTYEGYALAVTYEISGLTKMLDGSYVENAPTQFEMDVSSDWNIADTYYVTKDAEGNSLFEPTTDVLGQIDANGYLTPARNEDAAFNIRALFDCGGYTFERFLLVMMTKTNTFLTSLTIMGQDTVWDAAERNSTTNYEDGLWYVPYTAEAAFSDGTKYVPEAVTWEIADGTSVEGVSISTTTGRLYISVRQLSDGIIVLGAKHTALDDSTGQDETLSVTRRIQLSTLHTIISAYVELPLDNIEPNKPYSAEMFYTRRSGAEGSSKIPDSNTVKFEWYALETVPGFEITPDGMFSFASSDSAQEVVIACRLTEQRTSIVESMTVTCLGVGYPLHLNIEGFTNVRDDSVISMKARLDRQGSFSAQDVTDNVLWQITNSRGDTVTIPGVSIDRLGNVTLGKLLSDVVFGVRALFVEGNWRKENLMYVTAFSSYPYYGSAPWGIDSFPEVTANIKDRMKSSVGGTLVLAPQTNHYGYFVVRADYGEAEFAPASDAKGRINSGWLGWDGAKWPVTGSNGLKGPQPVQVVYDNLVDVLHIYRTEARAFGQAVLTVRYR